MAQITLKGNAINTVGELPVVGSTSSDFTLVAADLSEKSLADYKGSKVVLNIFPSIDTGVCAASVRAFNEKASTMENTKVLCISKDLPFATTRFCEAEGLKNVATLSDFRSSFGKDYQVEIIDGPLKGLLSRAIVILDEEGIVKYTEQVSETTEEPNYEAALAAL